jgi:hypothetical protein
MEGVSLEILEHGRGDERFSHEISASDLVATGNFSSITGGRYFHFSPRLLPEIFFASSRLLQRWDALNFTGMEVMA